MIFHSARFAAAVLIGSLAAAMAAIPACRQRSAHDSVATPTRPGTDAAIAARPTDGARPDAQATGSPGAEIRWLPAPAVGADGAVPGCDEAAYKAARDRTGQLYQEAQRASTREAFVAAGKQALDHYRRCGAVLTNPQRAWLLNDYALVRIRGGFGDCGAILRQATAFAAEDAKAVKAVAFNRRKCAETIQKKHLFTLDDVALLDAMLRPGKEDLPRPVVCTKVGARVVTLKHGSDPYAGEGSPLPIEYVFPDGSVKQPCGEMCDSGSNSDDINRIRKAVDLNGDGLVELEIHTADFIGSSQGTRNDENYVDRLLACGEGRYVVMSRIFDDEGMNPDLVYGFESITPLARYNPTLWPKERVDFVGKRGRPSAVWVRVDDE